MVHPEAERQDTGASIHLWKRENMGASKCLFGGALFAAGLAAHTANAQEFSFSYSFALTSVGDIVDGPP